MPVTDPYEKTTLRNKGMYGCPPFNQAQKIINRFGGEREIAKALGLNPVTVYRWQYIHPYGRNGLIPLGQIEKIKAAARINGIMLLPQDWVPERNNWSDEELAAREEARRTADQSSAEKAITLADLMA